MEPARFDDMIPGCYDPHERAKDLLGNGILASVAFPTLPGFAGRKFATFADPSQPGGALFSVRTDGTALRLVRPPLPAPSPGSRVDIRSVSRNGRGDFGVNATRVQFYLAALRAAAPSR